MFRDPQINVYVRDVERMVAFYTGHLGFAESFRTPDSGPPIHVELRLGGLVLGFADADAASEMHGLPIDPGPRRSEVVVWTDDVDRAYGDLLAVGATSISPPHAFIGRLRAAWIADPEGGPIQIVMECPQSQ